MPATMRVPPSGAQLCCYAVLALGCGCTCGAAAVLAGLWLRLLLFLCSPAWWGERCHYPKSITPVTRKRRKIEPTVPD